MKWLKLLYLTFLKNLLSSSYFYFFNPSTGGEILANSSQLSFAIDFSVIKISLTKFYIKKKLNLNVIKSSD